MGVARFANRIWWLMGPLLIAVTILTLPVADAEAYGAVPADSTPVFAASSDGPGAPEVDSFTVESGKVVHALEPVSAPFRCDTSCSPTNPLNHTALHARYELPAERFAALLAQAIPLHFIHGGNGIGTYPAIAVVESSPPLPPPQA